NPAAQFNDSLCQLALGNFNEGWRKYEVRWSLPFFEKWRIDTRKPFWKGDISINGKALLMHWEQGFGDTIQFCRYAELAKARGAFVILVVQPDLKPALRQLSGADRLITQGEELPTFDLFCPLMSAPFVFGSTLSSIPRKQQYLSADFSRILHWEQRLGPKRGPRIGIAWFGKSNEFKQSMNPSALEPILSSPFELISLHKQLRPIDVSFLQANPNLRYFGNELRDFGETAALIDRLDLVVSADTAVAHLAAAMGKQTWIVLPHPADWRWMLNRTDSPWYP